MGLQRTSRWGAVSPVRTSILKLGELFFSFPVVPSVVKSKSRKISSFQCFRHPFWTQAASNNEDSASLKTHFLYLLQLSPWLCAVIPDVAKSGNAPLPWARHPRPATGIGGLQLLSTLCIPGTVLEAPAHRPSHRWRPGALEERDASSEIPASCCALPCKLTMARQEEGGKETGREKRN